MGLASVSFAYVFLLLVAFEIKHFVCDFPLQTPYMLGKFRMENWFRPLAAHTAIHMAGTSIIICAWMLHTGVYGYWSAGLIILDGILHFAIDRLKALTTTIGGYTPKDPTFWNLIGLDQLAHQLTSVILVVLILAYTLNA